MAASLTDGCTDTFWESDEDDRNKSKTIDISMSKLSYVCKFIYVHIDNSRDIQVMVSRYVYFLHCDEKLLASLDCTSFRKAEIRNLGGGSFSKFTHSFASVFFIRRTACNVGMLL